MPRSPNEDVVSPSKPSPKVQRTIQSFFASTGRSASTPSLKRAATADDAQPSSPAKRTGKGRAGQQRSKPEPEDADGPSPEDDSTVATKPVLTKSKSTGTPKGQIVDNSVEGKAAPGNPTGVVSQLVDALTQDNLLLMFVGVNPGIRTAETGHAYAHPSNHYWRLLHASGLTPRRYLPSETHDMVGALRYGNTNLVARATKDASALTREELHAGVADIEAKARRVHARVVCLVGKGIWDAVERAWRSQARPVASFKYGFRPDKERMGKDPRTGWPGSRVFVATTTSARATGMSWEQKLAIWKELGDFIAAERQREEREAAAEAREEEEDDDAE